MLLALVTFVFIFFFSTQNKTRHRNPNESQQHQQRQQNKQNNILKPPPQKNKTELADWELTVKSSPKRTQTRNNSWKWLFRWKKQNSQIFQNTYLLRVWTGTSSKSEPLIKNVSSIWQTGS